MSSDRHTSRQTRGLQARSSTLSQKQLLTQLRREPTVIDADPVDDDPVDRPKLRGNCEPGVGVRPCPYVRCRHHLYLDVNPTSGSIKINFPDREPWELVETCALDVADHGGMTLEQVGAITNLTRERIRQIELKGMDLLRPLLKPHLDGDMIADRNALITELQRERDGVAADVVGLDEPIRFRRRHEYSKTALLKRLQYLDGKLAALWLAGQRSD